MSYRFRLEKKTLATFLALQFAQLALFFMGWQLFSPETLHAQVGTGATLILIAFLLIHLWWCFFEFFLHRYVLHIAVFPALRDFARKHNAHHALTYVRKTERGGALIVDNAYPIMEEAQREYSVFPKWVLVAFFAIVTPLLFGVQWLLPALPILLGGYLATFVSYVGYEVIHAYEHRSYEDWWKYRLEHPRRGRLWAHLYAFHIAHHAQPRANESVCGFLGFPLADILLGTYKKTSRVLVDGVEVAHADFEAPCGGLLIRTLDRWALASLARRTAEKKTEIA